MLCFSQPIVRPGFIAKLTSDLGSDFCSMGIVSQGHSQACLIKACNFCPQLLNNAYHYFEEGEDVLRMGHWQYLPVNDFPKVSLYLQKPMTLRGVTSSMISLFIFKSLMEVFMLSLMQFYCHYTTSTEKQFGTFLPQMPSCFKYLFQIIVKKLKAFPFFQKIKGISIAQ